MKIIVRPILDPHCETDLTHQPVSAIVEELWRLANGKATGLRAADATLALA